MFPVLYQRSIFSQPKKNETKFEFKPARLRIHLWFVPILLSSSSNSLAQLFLHTSSHLTLLFKKCSKNGVFGWHARAQLGEARGGGELGEASTSGNREAKHRLPPSSSALHMERFQMPSVFLNIDSLVQMVVVETFTKNFE